MREHLEETGWTVNFTNYESVASKFSRAKDCICPSSRTSSRFPRILTTKEGVMEYRVLPHGGEKISVIGLGAGSLSGTEDEMVAVLEMAIQNGINYFDLAPSIEAPFFACAKAFAGRREKIITQMHFGAVYKDGKYGISDFAVFCIWQSL